MTDATITQNISPTEARDLLEWATQQTNLTHDGGMVVIAVYPEEGGFRLVNDPSLTSGYLEQHYDSDGNLLRAAHIHGDRPEKPASATPVDAQRFLTILKGLKSEAS